MGLFSGIGKAIGKVVGGLTGASQAADAATQAAATQAASAQGGIDEQRRQFDITQANLQPFLQQGQGAIGQMGILSGLGGEQQLQDLIASIAAGPEFTGMVAQGEDALLQNAAATGGLRGGNTQAALAQFRPQMLSQAISERFGRLGGLAGIGSGIGSNLGNLGASNAQTIAQLLQQQGAATAGGQMAQGGVTRQAFGDLLNIGAMALGAKKAGMF